jgi:hypothetical protein
MKFVLGCLSLLIVYLFYGFLVAQFEIVQVPSSIKPEHPAPFFDYKGVTNVHSELSIGSGSIKEIVESAKQADLDFITLTDLNPFDSSKNYEGYHDNLLVIAAGKYSYLDSRIIYYTKSKSTPLPSSIGEMQVQITDLLSQTQQGKKNSSDKNSLLVLAHPFLPGYTWSGELPTGFSGVEIFNYKSILNESWRTQKMSSIMSLLIYPFNPNLAFMRLFYDPEAELNLWTKLNSGFSKVSGHLGLEATAKAVPFTGTTINFPSYESVFRLGSHHVILKSELTGNPDADRAKIYHALDRGEFYIGFDILGNPKGFNAVMLNGDLVHLMGSEVHLTKDLTLQVRVPSKPKSPFEIVIYKNGERFFTDSSQVLSKKITEPGIYRVVVRMLPYLPLPDAKKWLPWIYTNHFYVVD